MRSKLIAWAPLVALLIGATLLAFPQTVHAQCGVPGTPPCGEKEKRATQTPVPPSATATQTPTATPTPTPTLEPPAAVGAQPPTQPAGLPLLPFLLGGGLLAFLILAVLLALRLGRRGLPPPDPDMPVMIPPPNPEVPVMANPPDHDMPGMINPPDGDMLGMINPPDPDLPSGLGGPDT